MTLLGMFYLGVAVGSGGATVVLGFCRRIKECDLTAEQAASLRQDAYAAGLEDGQRQTLKGAA